MEFASDLGSTTQEKSHYVVWQELGLD